MIIWDMEDKMKFYGEWFLPGNIDKKIKGILTIKPNERFSELIMLGTFGEFNQHSQQSLILGVTVNDIDVTLYDCHISYQEGTSSLSPVDNDSSKQIRTNYQISYIFEGYHFYSLEKLRFNKIKSEILHFDDWLRISGFIPYGQSDDTRVLYKVPDSIFFEFGEYKGEISFSVTETGINRNRKRSELIQRVYLSLDSEESKSFEKINDEIIKFRNFLVLALYSHTNPLSISLYTDDYFFEHDVYSGTPPNLIKEIKKYRKKIKLYFPIRKANLNVRDKSDWYMLFTHEDIYFDFNNIIKNWYIKYNELRPALNLVFEQFYSVENVVETRFLNLAQAAETLHARLNPKKTQIPSNEFKEIKKNVTAALPEIHKSFANALRNDYFLGMRLKELVETYSTPFFLEIIKDSEQFVKDVKNSRNYYTHYPDSKKPNHLEGRELVILIDKLLLLLISAFLIEIGFDKNKLEKLLREKSGTLLRHFHNK